MRILTLILLLLAWSPSVHADPSGDGAQSQRLTILTPEGRNMKWPDYFKVQEWEIIRARSTTAKDTARLKGTYQFPEGTPAEIQPKLWANKKQVKLPGDGKFEFEVPLATEAAGQPTPVSLTLLDPTGKGRAVNLALHGWTPATTIKADLRAQGPWNFQLGTGLTLVSYTETAVPNYSGMLLTVKGSVGYAFPKSDWDLGVTGYGTVLPLSETPAGTGVKFVGANVRVGKALYRNQSLRIGLHGGAYWTTMFVSSQTLGFQNLMGPQIFPTVSMALPEQRAVRGYIKFAAIGQGLSLQSVSNQELALGAAYDWRLWGQRSSVSLDLSKLHFTVGVSEITSVTSSLGLSVSF